MGGIGVRKALRTIKSLPFTTFLRPIRKGRLKMSGLSVLENTGNSSTLSVSSQPTKRMVKRALLNLRRFSRGCAAHYIQINDSWGFKFYAYEDEARVNYFRQEISGHLTGLAPKLGSFIIRVRVDVKKLGELYSCRKIFWGFCVEHCNMRTPMYNKEHVEEYNKLVKIYDCAFGEDRTTWDTSPNGNVGYNLSGQLVVIDFDSWHCDGWLHRIPQIRLFDE